MIQSMATPEIDSSHWFETEVKPHEPALRGYLMNKVSERSDVDDVLQETYKRILQVQKTSNIESTRGLLFTIAKNATSDLFRRKLTSKTFPVAEIEQLGVLDSTETFETVSRIDEVEVLKEAIKTLPKRCQAVFVMRKFENLSHREIASRLNIAEHTVESQLTKGLRRCRKYFEKKGII